MRAPRILARILAAAAIGLSLHAPAQSQSVSETGPAAAIPYQVCSTGIGTQTDTFGANIAGTTYTNQDSRLALAGPKVACANPRILMAGIQIAQNQQSQTPVGETGWPNDYHMHAAFELGGSYSTAGANQGPLTVGGNAVWDVPQGYPPILTDLGPTAPTLPAFTNYEIRYGIYVDATSKYLVRPANCGTTYLTQVNYNSTITGQVTGTGPITVVNASASCFTPVAVIGQPVGTMASIGTFGMSITGGTTDTNPNAYGHIGWIQKGMDLNNPNTPRMPLSRAAAETPDYLNAAIMRIGLLQYLTHLIVDIGTNDATFGGITVGQLETQTAAIWAQAAAAGKPVIAVPMFPRGTSSLGLTFGATAGLPTIASGGTGYAASSTFNVTLSGGTLATGTGQGTPASISVTTNSSGVVTTLNSVTAIGYYSTAPSTTNSPTGGTGSGLSISNLVFAQALDKTSQTPGTNFVSGGYRDTFNAWIYSQLQAGVISAIVDPSNGRYAIGTAASWVTVPGGNIEDQSNEGYFYTNNGAANGSCTVDTVHLSSSYAINCINRAALTMQAFAAAEGW